MTHSTDPRHILYCTSECLGQGRSKRLAWTMCTERWADIQLLADGDTRTGHPLAIRTGHPLASRLHVACRAHSTKSCECQTTSKRFDEAEDETATVARGHTHRRRQALRWRRYQMKAPTCEEKVAARRGAAASVCTDRGGSGVRSVRARAGTHAGSSRGARRGGAAKGCAPVLHGH